MKNIVITAADENFAHLLAGLLDSLLQWETKQFNAVGVLDVGLTESTLREISKKVDHVVTPGWDLPISEDLRKSKPHLRALSARPFLPDYFPGYDRYLWIDADAWVQEKFALEWLFAACAEKAIGIVPQIDRSYIHGAKNHNWRERRLREYFGESALSLIATNTYYNAGVFSLRPDAPHWKAWRKHFELGLLASQHYISDQTALNYAIWTEQLPVHPLPALCNWCCHLAFPTVDSLGRLREPHIPNRLLGIVHLSSITSDLRIRAKDDKNKMLGSLRFRGMIAAIAVLFMVVD